MIDLTNPQAATAAVTDPQTSATDLATIAQYHSSLRPLVAAHPQAYPGLLEWLQGQGDDATKAAVATRLGDTADPLDATVFAPLGLDVAPAPVVPVVPATPVVPPTPAEPPAGPLAVPRTTPPSTLRGELKQGVAEVAQGFSADLKDAWKSEGESGVSKAFNRGEIIFGFGKYIIIGIVVIVAAVFIFRGCAAESAAKDVTCSQFNSMSLSKQDNTINALLSSHNKQTGGQNLSLAHAQIMIGCYDANLKIDDVINWR
ncbi:MAG: hypothetical protein LBI33_04590 [Propionibacteriaceae bacterium]|jgi:hypothetical protein|nr:hypothetical protein [Propionibacteriaceae bacterium]